ncbi:hypothetical protein BC826DRAFT_614788 [Russula brevipes]|nr:hypothetical protein BC826DRAFT_614788 [Russula brevipes]
MITRAEEMTESRWSWPNDVFDLHSVPLADPKLGSNLQIAQFRGHACIHLDLDSNGFTGRFSPQLFIHPSHITLLLSGHTHPSDQDDDQHTSARSTISASDGRFYSYHPWSRHPRCLSPREEHYLSRDFRARSCSKTERPRDKSRAISPSQRTLV